MQTIKLFPLHTVLFPGMLLPLHIFEPRYRLMIQRCLDEESTFGVVLIRQGLEALGPLATPHRVGTSARILRVDRLADGRMNLIAAGEERFRILALQEDQSYLTATVEMAPMDIPATLNAIRETRALQPWLSAYLRLITSLGDEVLKLQLDQIEIPHDPLSMLYAAAWLLQVPLEEKQPLLESETAAHLLDQLGRLYRREMAITHHLRQANPQSANLSAWLN